MKLVTFLWFTYHPVMYVDCISYVTMVTGRLSEKVVIRSGTTCDTLCKSLNLATNNSDAPIYDVYKANCERPIRARYLDIIQQTKNTTQLKICEVAVKIIGTA